MNLKDRVFSAALQLFLKYGIKSVSMDDICQNLAISKKTIYHFIQNKEELVSKAIEKRMALDERNIKKILTKSQDAIDEMVNITQYAITMLKEMTPALIYDLKKYHPEIWKKVDKTHISFIEDVIYKNLVRGQEEGIYRPDFDPFVVARLYMSKTTSIVDSEQFSTSEFETIQLIKEMIMYHLHGIVSDSGKIVLPKYQNKVSTL
ncbi:MAG: TetR/AcrR family transcriptional regulator [Saprospiraceae bacterium]|jgi:AcrR family transcriptional regulator|nr:TetR/AcrR family transcriptional regulator [Saprospiraceae bacterium]